MGFARNLTSYEWREKYTQTENIGDYKGNAKDRLKLEVTKIILELGIPAHIKGFSYLREAIIIIVEADKATVSMTKILYPAIADIFDTTATRAERAIRHAIGVAWNRGDSQMRQKFFGVTIAEFSWHPTNSEFIATIADYIKIRACDNGS